MYIDPFWCGVAATILTELAFTICVGLIATRNSNEEDK